MLYIMRYITIYYVTSNIIYDCIASITRRRFEPGFCLGSMRQGVGRFTGAGAG